MGTPSHDRKTRQQGSAMAPTTGGTQSWERCTVVDVNLLAYTCDVVTASGRPVGGLAWPGIGTDPAGRSGTISVPRKGQVLALSSELPTQCLVHTLPGPVLDDGAPSHKVFHDASSDGGGDPLLTGEAVSSYRGGCPPDVMEGDWVQVGSQGNMVGVLEGGVNIFKASELAKVVATSAGDLLQLVGRNVDLYTDFGAVTFRTEDGRTSMSLRGGSQQLTESAPAEEKFTLHLDLGHKGDVANFRITDTTGAVLGQVHYWPDGRVETRNSGEIDEVNGASTKIIRGAEQRLVSGDSVSVVDGLSSESAGAKSVRGTGGLTLTSGMDLALGAGQDAAVMAGRNLTVTASGPAEPTPEGVTYKTVVTNGSMYVDIGSPDAGDSQPGKSGYRLKASGDISMTSTLGDVEVNTTPGRAVILGGPEPRPGVAKRSESQVARAKELQSILSEMLDLLAEHTHVAPQLGSDTTPSKMPGGPQIGFSHTPALKARLASIASKIVSLGG